MEQRRKQVKKGGFQSTEEAGLYVDEILSLRPSLPINIWALILSKNDRLSLKDINRMCQARPDTFGSVCNDGSVWRLVFERQYGSSEFNRIMQMIPPEFRSSSTQKHYLVALMARRVYDKLFRDRFIELGDVENMRVVVDGEMIRIPVAFENNADGTVTMTSFEDAVSEQVFLETAYPDKAVLLDVFKTILGPEKEKSIGNYRRPNGRKDLMKTVWTWDIWQLRMLKQDPSAQINPKIFTIIYLAIRQGLKTPTRSEYLECVVCQQITETVCGKCKNTPYCSIKCQFIDFKKHECLQ